MLENRAKEICEENVLCLVDKNTRGKPKTVWIFSVTFLGACPGAFFDGTVWICLYGCWFDQFVRGLYVDRRHCMFKPMADGTGGL